MHLDADAPLAIEVIAAIRGGDLPGLRTLLAADPDLATAWIGPRSLLHVVADWPGHVANGGATVAALVAAGADVDARFRGSHSETPLHWAASCDDVAVLDALLDAGADVEASGAVIAGGTAMADATAFGQWHAARRLVNAAPAPRCGSRRPSACSIAFVRPSRPSRRRPRTPSPPRSGARAMGARRRSPLPPRHGCRPRLGRLGRPHAARRCRTERGRNRGRLAPCPRGTLGSRRGRTAIAGRRSGWRTVR